MWRATLVAGQAALTVRDGELRMLEYAIAASIVLHLLALGALQMVAPRPEPPAPTPGPINARLVEPKAPSARAVAPRLALHSEPEVEAERRVESRPKVAPKPEPKVEAERRVEPKPKVAPKPEPAIKAKPKPALKTRPRPNPKQTPESKPKTKTKTKTKSEPTGMPRRSDNALASVAPAPSIVPSAASATPLPGPSASTAPLPASASSAAVIDEDLLARYRLQLISAARRYKRYPRAALDNQWEGAAEVAMVIGGNGRIREMTISKSSGYAVLDRQAIDMFRKAKPLVPIPSALRGRELRVTLKAIYSLRDPGA